MEPLEDTDVSGQQFEHSVRRHSGVLLIIQTVIGGILVFVATNVYLTAKDANNTAQEGAKAMIGVQVQLTTLQAQVSSIQIQMQGVTNIAMTEARNEVKQAELERRIAELEQTRKLR